LALSQIVWDADEVLWDWVMSASALMKSLPRMAVRGYAHREFLRTKPGIFELLWGMRHAAVDAGESVDDTHVRLWTDGYPWRLWRIAEAIPGMSELLGPGPSGLPSSADDFREHPRVFSRTDFEAALVRVIAESPHSDALPTHLSERLGAAIRSQEARSTWKIPELARWVGKSGFERSAILVDDARKNVETFAKTGRRAIHLASPTPRVLFGKLRNSVWNHPPTELERLASKVAEPLVQALERVGGEPAGTILNVSSSEPVTDWTAVAFEIDVPDDRIREEWIEPVKRIKRALEEAS